MKAIRVPVGSPRYRCRVAALLALFPRPEGQCILDIGCGDRTLPTFLARQGFDITVADISLEACEYQRQLAQQAGVAITVHHGEVATLRDRNFDIVTAFDVLEHVEEDTSALKDWSKLVKENGLLYLSVPAHQRGWSHLDEMVGHWRRYERQQIRDVISAAGLHTESLWCYGFPVANVADLFFKVLERRRALDIAHRQSIEDRNTQSGVHRSMPWLQLAAGSLLGPLMGLQRFFYHTELGNGYLIKARKPPAK